MPVKKQKTKSRRFKALGSTEATQAVEELISGVEHWPSLVTLLAGHYQLPDLSSKKGLKECYRNIDTISISLREAFDETSNVRLKGGIVGIWGKLGYDAVIWNKLAHQDILKRIVSMLDKEETLLITLKTLATITRHGGKESRNDVAEAATPGLIKALKTHKNPQVTHLTTTILAHTVAYIFFDRDPIYKNFPSIKMQEILPVVHKALCDDGPAPQTFDHAKFLVMSASRHAYFELERHPPSFDFIVGCLRVSDLLTRATAMNNVLRTHLHQNNPIPMMKPDFMGHLSTVQHLPRHLQDAVTQYGSEKSDLYTSLKAVRDYQVVQMKAAQTRNYFQLGLELADLILDSEYAISEGVFQDDNGVTRDLGMPYNNFVDSLPVAAQALRDKDPVKYADQADMLQMKFHIARKQSKSARSVAEAAIARNNQNPYWHYVCAVSEGEKTARQLRWAKRGLACLQIQKTRSPYLRFNLLDNAATAALETGLELLETATAKGSDSSILALAFLHSAKNDATTFVNEAPPDCRGMSNMLVILMCTDLILRGNEMSPDLREFKSLREKLKLSEEFTRYLRPVGGPTLWNRTFKSIVERYERAAKFWDSRLEDCNTHTMQHHHGPGDEYVPTDELQELFSTVNLDDEGQPATEARAGCKIGISYVDTSIIRLYQCSYCGNSSAALKKCSRCAGARYCDASCQKDHWKVHKRDCGALTPKSR